MVLSSIFIFVFIFNLLPAFTPPTWMVLSYLQINFHPQPFVLAFTGACAATAGRLLLAKLSRVIIRNNLLSERTKTSLAALQRELEARQTLTFSLFLFYAFSPLPSNQLFLAYGLTSLRLRLVALPFFLGRLASYSFWVFTASEALHLLSAQTLKNKTFFGGYFVLSQTLAFAVIFIFAKIDWAALLKTRKVRWLK